MGYGIALRRIRLSNCEGITDIGLSALGDNCCLLKELNISSCKNITDIGVSALGVGCPLLIVLISLI